MKLTEKIPQKVLLYMEELKKWSRYFNLHSFDEMDFDREIWEVSKCFVEEIKSAPLKAEICDIGSGNGIPGIVIKILIPKAKITLVESNRKKAHFLEKTASLLQLKNIMVLHQDVKFLIRENRYFDIVTSRAFGLKFPNYALKLLKKEGTALYFAKNPLVKFKIKPDEIKKYPLGYILKWVK